MLESRAISKDAYRMLAVGVQLAEEAVNGDLKPYRFLRTSGHAATTQQSSVCDHHQPTALSLTSTYASTKRLGGAAGPQLCAHLILFCFCYYKYFLFYYSS